VFVVGNVKKPGAFPLGDGAETSVLKMLAMAEGLAPSPASRHLSIAGKHPGRRTKYPFELNKIMERKAPDAPLLANDVLYVTDSHGAALGFAILEKVMGFGHNRRRYGPNLWPVGDHGGAIHSTQHDAARPEKLMQGRRGYGLLDPSRFHQGPPREWRRWTALGRRGNSRRVLCGLGHSGPLF